MTRFTPSATSAEARRIHLHQSENLANWTPLSARRFSYGDYLRTAPSRVFAGDEVRRKIRETAAEWYLASATASRFCGEAGLLPGAMMRNSGLRFICRRRTHPRRADGHAVHHAAQKGQILKLPIAHRMAITTAMKPRSLSSRRIGR